MHKDNAYFFHQQHFPDALCLLKKMTLPPPPKPPTPSKNAICKKLTVCTYSVSNYFSAIAASILV